jgi:stress-induced-phosphoprotein 1
MLTRPGTRTHLQGHFDVAVALYSKALELCDDESQRKVYYSNRAAAYFGQKKFNESREDAVKCTELDDQWAKGWYRKGLAEEGLERYREAEESFRKGVDCAPRDEAIQRALQEVKMMV